MKDMTLPVAQCKNNKNQKTNTKTQHDISGVFWDFVKMSNIAILQNGLKSPKQIIKTILDKAFIFCEVYLHLMSDYSKATSYNYLN